MRNLFIRSILLILFDINLPLGLQVAAFCIIFFALMNLCLHGHENVDFKEKPFTRPLYTFQGKTLNIPTSQYVAFYNFTRKKYLGRELHLSMTSPLRLHECLPDGFRTLSRSCQSSRLISEPSNTSEQINHQTEALLNNKPPTIINPSANTKSQSAAGVSYAPLIGNPKHPRIRSKARLDSKPHIKQVTGFFSGEQEFFSAKSDTNSLSSNHTEVCAAKVNECKVVSGLPPVPRPHDENIHKEVENNGKVEAERFAHSAVPSETASTQTTKSLKKKKSCHSSDSDKMYSKNKQQKKIKRNKKSVPKKNKESSDSMSQLDGKKSLSNQGSAKSSSTLDTPVFYDFVRKKTVKFSSSQKDEVQKGISPTKASTKEEQYFKATSKLESQQNSRRAEEKHPKSGKEEPYSKTRAAEKTWSRNIALEESCLHPHTKEVHLKSPSTETSQELNTKMDASQTCCIVTNCSKSSPSKIVGEDNVLSRQGSLNSVPKLKDRSKEDIHTSCHHCMFRHRKHISKIQQTGKQCALTAEIPLISHQSHTRMIESAFNEDRAKLCLNAAKALLLLSQDNYKSQTLKTKEVKKKNVMTSPIPLTPPNSVQISGSQAAVMLTAGYKNTKTPTSLDYNSFPEVPPITLQNDIGKHQYVVVKTFSAESSANGTFGLIAKNKSQHELEGSEIRTTNNSPVVIMTRSPTSKVTVNSSPQSPPQRKRRGFSTHPSSSDWSFEVTCLIDG